MLILASASPRRAELLRQIGVKFEQHPVDIDERPKAGEPPEEYVERLAREKAFAGLDDLGDGPILGSDTAVVADGEILGKPRDQAHFVAMMERLSGTTHQVMSAVAILDRETCKTAISVTDVRFRSLNRAEIVNYWQTGEPRDKAGGYAIQGMAAEFIARIEGSYSGVMGLPLYETSALLRDFGVLPNNDIES